jgi:hypothetical protein
MNDLVRRVMEVAANELLHQEAIQVDQEMEELLAEMALVPHVEGCLDGFMLRFFALLKRRSETAKKALVIVNGHDSLRMGESAARTGGLFPPDVPNALVGDGRVDDRVGDRGMAHEDLEGPWIDAVGRLSAASRVAQHVWHMDRELDAGGRAKVLYELLSTIDR